MAASKLRYLSRRDLIDIIYALKQEVTRLEGERDQLAQALEDRRIAAREGGSIAEASLRLNQVFEAAQAAADQYVLSVQAAADQTAAQQAGITGASDGIAAGNSSTADGAAADPAANDPAAGDPASVDPASAAPALGSPAPAVAAANAALVREARAYARSVASEAERAAAHLRLLLRCDPTCPQEKDGQDTPGEEPLGVAPLAQEPQDPFDGELPLGVVPPSRVAALGERKPSYPDPRPDAVAPEEAQVVL